MPWRSKGKGTNVQHFKVTRSRPYQREFPDPQVYSPFSLLERYKYCLSKKERLRLRKAALYQANTAKDPVVRERYQQVYDKMKLMVEKYGAKKASANLDFEVEKEIIRKNDAFAHGNITINGENYYYISEGWYPNCLTDVKEEYLYAKKEGYKGSLKKFAEDRARAANENSARREGVNVNKENHVKTIEMFDGIDGTDRITIDLYKLREGGKNVSSDKKSNYPIFWHGSASCDLRGGSTGLHLGTKKAANVALEARIGIPADGKGWTGNREYGKTLLAGKKTLHKIDPKGYNITGYNCDAPEEDYYPTKPLYYPDGTSMPFSVKPNVVPYRIIGQTTNTPNNPHTDFKANGYMRANLKKGSAKKGFYYINVGEEEGSISIVVPNGSFVIPAEVKH